MIKWRKTKYVKRFGDTKEDEYFMPCKKNGENKSNRFVVEPTRRFYYSHSIDSDIYQTYNIYTSFDKNFFSN